MKEILIKQISVEVKSGQIWLCESRIWNDHRWKFCQTLDGGLDFYKEYELSRPSSSYPFLVFLVFRECLEKAAFVVYQDVTIIPSRH